MYCLGNDLNGLKIINLPLHSHMKPSGRFAITKVIKWQCVHHKPLCRMLFHYGGDQTPGTNQGRVCLAWQFEGTVWQERHSHSSLKQLNTVFPQSGESREGKESRGGRRGRWGDGAHFIIFTLHSPCLEGSSYICYPSQEMPHRYAKSFVSRIFLDPVE